MIFSLISCNKEEVPEGLQVVAISEEEGFKFYGPDGWIIVNDVFNADYKVYATKRTGKSKTSITFVQAPMPEKAIAEYFSDSINSPVSGIAFTVVKEPTKTTFGNADEAYNCIYTYKYSEYDSAERKSVEKDMTCLQYFIKHGGKFYIYTYTAYGTPTDEAGEYQTYLSLVNTSVESFLFTEKTEAAKEPTYETDSDGYMAVSDKGKCGYVLYLPADYTVVGNDGDVEAKISDSAALSITKASSTGVNVLTYFEMRRNDLAAIASDVKDIKITVKADYDEENDFFDDWDMVMPTVDSSIKFGDLSNIASFEYTYVYGGVTYHVYQMVGVDFRNGFVLTYTATEEEYEKHLDEIKIILEKVKF